MNRGVELLLARMDSNPEEFRTLGSGRWTWAINGNKPDFLEVEEWDMLQAKLQTLRAEEYAQAVMRELLTDTPNTVQSTFLGLQQTLHTTFLDLQQTLHKQSKERS